jgi:hypothetical protein
MTRLAATVLLIIRDMWRQIEEQLDNRAYVCDEKRAKTIAEHHLLQMPGKRVSQ